MLCRNAPGAKPVRMITVKFVVKDKTGQDPDAKGSLNVVSSTSLKEFGKLVEKKVPFMGRGDMKRDYHASFGKGNLCTEINNDIDWLRRSINCLTFLFGLM